MFSPRYWIYQPPCPVGLVLGTEGGACRNMAWLVWLCIRKEDSQGRFPGRPRFLLEMGVRALFVCFGVGGWVGYYGNIA